MPQLEVRRSCQQNSCYRPHTHDAFSIGLIDQGTSVFVGALGGVIGLEPGDVILIPAAQVHSCNPNRGSWVYQMMHLDQRWAVSLAPAGPASRVFSGVSVLRRPDLHEQLAALTDLIFADEAAGRIEAGFRELFAELEVAQPDHYVAGGADSGLLDVLAPVMERLAHDETNPPLSELAASVGMSTYQLVRAMKRATGLAPLAWRQNARVIAARHLLGEGRSIAETAYALGFTDQAHFHRIFRAHVAASPGSYRG